MRGVFRRNYETRVVVFDDDHRLVPKVPGLTLPHLVPEFIAINSLCGQLKLRARAGSIHCILNSGTSGIVSPIRGAALLRRRVDLDSSPAGAAGDVVFEVCCLGEGLKQGAKK